MTLIICDVKSLHLPRLKSVILCHPTGGDITRMSPLCTFASELASMRAHLAAMT